MADSEAAQDNPSKRHCAFCLQLKPYKVCTGCRRRAYCSLKCQKEDWKPTGKGQGHRNWCKIEHGQEDVDWEVRPIPGKGLGIVAKRLIPSKYKLIVEGLHFYPNNHPAIADLTPDGGTLADKFNNNAKKSDYFTKPFVLLRTCRVKHSCSPNSESSYCNMSNVAVLHASRDIQFGEEIGYAYVNLYSHLRDPGCYRFSTTSHLKVMREALKKRHRITCPAECVCLSPKFKQNIATFGELYRAFKAEQRSSTIGALDIAEKIIALMMNDELYASLETIADFHGECSALATERDVQDNLELVRLGLHHAKKAHEILSEILPLSQPTADYLTAVTCLRSVVAFLQSTA